MYFFMRDVGWPRCRLTQKDFSFRNVYCVIHREDIANLSSLQYLKYINMNVLLTMGQILYC